MSTIILITTIILIILNKENQKTTYKKSFHKPYKEYTSFEQKEKTLNSCPRCNIGTLVIRKSKKTNTKYTTNTFIGCNRYPKCKYTQKIKKTEANKEQETTNKIKKYSKEWSEAKKKINNSHKIKKTSYKEKIIKGAEYEEYVAKVYRSRGYHVTEYGKKMGKKDHGIDLIAKKEKHLVLIQCKNWEENGKWKITHKDIKVFQSEARLFVENKPLLRNCLLNARYTISGNFIHESAIKHLEEMQKIGKRIDYEIIEMPNY